MTSDEKRDLIEILNIQIKHLEDKNKANGTDWDTRDIDELQKVAHLIEIYPSSDDTGKDEARAEYANRLIEVIKDYRDTGREQGRLDRNEQHICNRIKYFTERLRDTWDKPEAQTFI